MFYVLKFKSGASGSCTTSGIMIDRAIRCKSEVVPAEEFQRFLTRICAIIFHIELILGFKVSRNIEMSGIKASKNIIFISFLLRTIEIKNLKFVVQERFPIGISKSITRSSLYPKLI